MNSKLLVYVIAHYRWKELELCLRHLEQYTSSSNTEIIILENIPTFETKQVLDTKCKFPRLLTTHSSEFYKPVADYAISRGTQLVCKLDEDVFVTPDWDKRLLECFERNPWAKMISPLSPIQSIIGAYYLLLAGQLDEYIKIFPNARLFDPVFGTNACHDNPESVRWIWEHSVPWMPMVKRFRDRNVRDMLWHGWININCNIHLLDMWREVGVSCKYAGEDEVLWTKEYLWKNKYPLIVDTSTLVYHGSFFQEYQLFSNELIHLMDRVI